MTRRHGKQHKEAKLLVLLVFLQTKKQHIFGGNIWENKQKEKSFLDSNTIPDEYMVFSLPIL